MIWLIIVGAVVVHFALGSVAYVLQDSATEEMFAVCLIGGALALLFVLLAKFFDAWHRFLTRW